MLEVRNISSGYGKKQVLFDVSMTINSGDVVLLTGGNGSGKSTLLKCIYNILPLWNGEVFFNDEKISGLKPSDLIRRGIVYIPQKDFCFENLTVEENLQIAGTIYKKQELKKRIEKVYVQTGLDKFRKRKPYHLSGGEKKLLAFGMGLIHEPQMFMFDEPFAGVDVETLDKMKNLIDEIICQNISFIIVEHGNFKPVNDKLIKLYIGKIRKG